ncbi:DNA glycosylase [Tilletiaria anomala UBC 951]|uniref:DNA glycosylase n=1 Tax=Tilletiaria anomala (strain ATCC 24038 / CBS 436.72 / UBC 951) TaxID=1037660 RepID=A0A066VUH3_TILAU|nr:DNA glycosylase [Tilletiaria anomala UBC 951]KDN43913.1 DNA glycosylase [Tilletiaria anomala UBC 951]
MRRRAAATAAASLLVTQETVPAPPQAATATAAPALMTLRARRNGRTTNTDSVRPLSKEDDRHPEKQQETPDSAESKSQQLSARKLAAYSQSSLAGPFPGFAYPTAEEAEKVAYLLADWHGYRKGEEAGETMLPRHRKPQSDDNWGGCGNVPSVLDALIRTVLSCNTSSRNSTAAHKSLVARFGRQNWEAILDAPHTELVEAIRCGGLANSKARTIRAILEQTRQRHGCLSLDHLHAPDVADGAIMRELLAFPGVGPKVATCVLMFCIGRDTIAVDTHVWRLSKMLGWVPDTATRDQTCYHLEERLPPPLKYPLHVLLIKHGKMCGACSARGFATVEMDNGSSNGGVQSGAEDERDREDLEEQSGLASGDAGAGAAGAQDERKKGREARPCPLRQHGFVHSRTYSKKMSLHKAEGDADIDASPGKPKSKRRSGSSHAKEDDESAAAEADGKPISTAGSCIRALKRAKKEDVPEAGVSRANTAANAIGSGGSRSSSRKRAKAEA